MSAPVDAASASRTKHTSSLARLWRWWLPIALCSFALAVLFADPFAGDWDALDYTVLALEGRPSSMLLGRGLFIFTNHLLWRAAHALTGMEAQHAYLLFKGFVIAQSFPCVMLWWLAAYELTRSRKAATIAALLIALSPFYVVYSGQAMTEIPSLTLLAGGLVLYNRGVRDRRTMPLLAGAVVLGAGVNVRELAALYAPWLVIAPLVYGWRFSRREMLAITAACALFAVAAVAPFAIWYGFDVQDYRAWWHGWVESTRAETARHPVTLANLRPLLLYFFIAAPLALLLPAAALHQWKRRARALARLHTRNPSDIHPSSFILHPSSLSPVLAFGILGTLANLSLVVHYSVVLNGRYMLTGLPAVATLVAAYLARTNSFESFTRKQKSFAVGANRRVDAFARTLLVAACVNLIVGGIVFTLSSKTLAAHRRTGAYIERLRLLPSDAVLISGAQTVSVTYWRGIRAGAWETIGTGGGYYGEPWLVSTIDERLRSGRRVFLDADPGIWATRGWQLEETRAVARLSTRFRFRRVSDDLYELRPTMDVSADDDPRLALLLLTEDEATN